MSEAKKPEVTFQFKGAIPLADGVTLDVALARLKEIELALKAHSPNAEAKVSVPRLVRVSLSEV